MKLSFRWCTSKMAMVESNISHPSHNLEIESDRANQKLKTLHLVRENEAEAI